MESFSNLILEVIGDANFINPFQMAANAVLHIASSFFLVKRKVDSSYLYFCIFFPLTLSPTVSFQSN